MGNTLILKLVEIYSENECAFYGGVQAENACCKASCGACGGEGCESRPGGNNCCINPIPKAHVCGSGQVGSEQGAPCFLRNGKIILSKSNCTFESIMSENKIQVKSYLYILQRF